jgi:hypothetical protein
MERIKDRPEQFRPPIVIPDQIPYGLPEFGDDVAQGSERLWMSERVAGANQDPGRGGGPIGKPAHQHRLPDAGLPAEEHDSPMAGLCVAKMCLQFRDARFPPEQFHCVTLPGDDGVSRGAPVPRREPSNSDAWGKAGFPIDGLSSPPG